MIIYEKIETLEKAEVKNISLENTSFTASLVSHINKCEKIAKALTDEINKYKTIVKDNEEHFTGNKLVTVTHKDSPHFSKEDFIAVYGEEEYKKFIRITDAKTVIFG